MLEDTFSLCNHEIFFQIATFFAQNYSNRILVMTKTQILFDEADRLFGSLSVAERSLILFHYCKDYQTVLDKLLEMDLFLPLPKVVIIESLVIIFRILNELLKTRLDLHFQQQWYNSTTPLEKIPSIYTTIIAAAQDLINVNSRNLKQSCFSFITSDPDELPTSTVELFYDFPIVASRNCLQDVFKTHKNLTVTQSLFS